MGRAKEEMMRQQELEPFYEWLEDNYGDDTPEEDSEEWDIAFQEFCDCKEQQAIYELEDYYRSEYEWLLKSKSPHGKFLREIRNIGNLLNTVTDSESYFSLLVMLHAHTVASLEAYLATTFIQNVTQSDALIKKTIEADDKLSKLKLTLKQFYDEEESVKKIVANHLGNLVFHYMPLVKPLFQKVLNIDFGEIDWLIKAVETRHDCVHRAGLNKEGVSIDLTVQSILELTLHSSILVEKIEKEIVYVKELPF
ncbi:hypothetical protein [Vreelandella sedimenti]|uniref:hypothetical protein n=1 Tax=Vreelandella sedimenti TaxID=2729618 RepID=UPI00257CEDB7|nr:hypothetical protein [Halomonas sp. UBA3173]|tara:strand:- start:161179 stop:161934 length:756 start_codon:yes stop_codon:yes gene_type:complete